MPSTLAEFVLGVKAAAFVASNAVTPTYNRQRGFASTAIVRNGAGDYTLTLSDAIDTAADLLILYGVSPAAAALATMSATATAATTIRTKTQTITAVPAITAADLDFWIRVSEIGPN